MREVLAVDRPAASSRRTSRPLAAARARVAAILEHGRPARRPGHRHASRRCSTRSGWSSPGRASASATVYLGGHPRRRSRSASTKRGRHSSSSSSRGATTRGRAAPPRLVLRELFHPAHLRDEGTPSGDAGTHARAIQPRDWPERAEEVVDETPCAPAGDWPRWRPHRWSCQPASAPRSHRAPTTAAAGLDAAVRAEPRPSAARSRSGTATPPTVTRSRRSRRPSCRRSTKLYPNVTVDHQEIPYDDLRQKLVTGLAGGILPGRPSCGHHLGPGVRRPGRAAGAR